jgi:hypothetical protein
MVLFVRSISLGSLGALTEQKTIPILAMAFTCFNHDESLNSITALLLGNFTFLKKALIVSSLAKHHLCIIGINNVTKNHLDLEGI